MESGHVDSQTEPFFKFGQVPTPADLTGTPFFPLEDGRCPINDLPPELLSHIFHLGTARAGDSGEDASDDEGDEVDEDDWTDETDDDSDSGSEDEHDNDDDNSENEHELPFVVLVSHVCRRWRELALDTPEFWTDINFEEPYPYNWARLYLERSKNAPLDIQLDLSESPDNLNSLDSLDTDLLMESIVPAQKCMETALALIIPHVSHWRMLEISVCDFAVMQPALVAMGKCESAPMLEILQLYHYESDDDETEEFSMPEYREQDFVLFRGNAPLLTHVALWGVHLDWTNSTFLAGLHDFELAYHTEDVQPSYKDFMRILNDSPDLETLTICESGPAGGPVDWLRSISGQDLDSADPSSLSLETTTIILPSLVNLVLSFLKPEYATPLLARLAIPKLTHLAIDFEEGNFDDFLRVLSCPHPHTRRSVLEGLQALKISGLPCENIELIRGVYTGLPNLRSLNISFGFVSWKWYAILDDQWAGASRTAQEPFLPQLEALTTSGLASGALRQLLEKRKLLGRPVKQLYMDEDDELDEEDYTWFRKHVETFDQFEGSDVEDVVDLEGAEDLFDGLIDDLNDLNDQWVG